MATSEQLVTECLTPLSEGEPEGVDAKYEPEYMVAHGEIAKMTSGGGTDWDAVAENCTILLTRKTKDINVAGYLCLALLKTKGYQGLAQGIEIYMGLLSSFEYYPKKKSETKTHKIRSNAIEWLNLRLSEFIDAFPPDPDNDAPESIVRAFDRLQEIKDFVQEQFRPPPSLTKFIEILGRYREKAQKNIKPPQEEAPPKKPEPKQPGDPASNVEPVPGSTSAKNTEGVLEKPKDSSGTKRVAEKAVISGDLDNPAGTLTAIAGVIREKDPADPMAYRLMRMVKWENLKNEPPSDNTGKTRIPAPRPETMTAVKNAFSAQDPLIAIRVCENAFSDYGLWWLDLQYNILMAMNRAGHMFERAKEAVKSELISLMTRFPKVIDMAFSDGTPFADEQTQAYVQDLTVSDNGSGAEIDASVPSDDALGKIMKKSKKLASENDLDGALAFLQRGVNESYGQRNRFYCRLQAGSICLKYGRLQEAQIILEDLYTRSSTIHLRDWDPKFYLTLCMTLERVYRRNGKHVSPDKQKLIHEQVLRQNLGYQLTAS